MSKPLGLAFFSGSTKDAVQVAKGLCVFPSAPGLATIERDVRYRQALVSADTRFVDSGFLALSWALMGKGFLSRISGLRFLKALLGSSRLRRQKSLWVHPTPQHQSMNTSLLFAKKIPDVNQLHYVAPLYPKDGELSDSTLLDICLQKRPEIIVINLGSNIQEPLGAYLKENLDYKPTIFCTGGAIDFFTGAQAAIPDWADRLYLGWLFRILSTPPSQAKQMRTSPAKRYVTALKLWNLLWKWGERLPKG